jgi:general stress protein 26
MNQDATARVWELAKSIRNCMLTSWDGKRQRSRPMASRVHEDRHVIYFLDKNDSEKERQIKEFPAISLTYTDTGGNKYIAISGTAVVSNDRALIKELWSSVDKAWWDSESDPSIRVITVTPEDAEMWDGPNKVIAAGLMLFAATTGAKPSFGENKKVAM